MTTLTPAQEVAFASVEKLGIATDDLFINWNAACHWCGSDSQEARSLKLKYDLAMARYQRAGADLGYLEGEEA